MDTRSELAKEKLEIQFQNFAKECFGVIPNRTTTQDKINEELETEHSLWRTLVPRPLYYQDIDQYTWKFHSIYDAKNSLKAIKQKLPELHEDFFNKNLNYQNDYLRFNRKIALLYLHFPEHANFLCEKLLADVNTFKRFVPDYHAFIDIARAFRHDTNKVVQFLIQHPSEFQRIIKNSDVLAEMMGTLPNFANVFTQYVFTTPGEFTRLIPNIENLNQIKRMLIWYNVKSANVCTRPIDSVDIFKAGYAIKYGDEIYASFQNDELFITMDQFAHHILTTPTEYNRLITSDDDSHQLKRLAPKAFNDVDEIKRIARWVSVLRTNSRMSFFSCPLPNEILAKIAVYGRNTHTYSQEEAETIALRHLVEPENLPKFGKC